MPSLSDTLDRLEHESIQISRFASENDRPPGPFTSAFLNLPTRDNPRPSILSLIRDSDESERRPFRDVNEDEYLNVGGPSVPSSGPRKSIAPGGGRGEGAGGDAAAGRHLLTPLRDLARKRNTPGELEATLTAADKVAESLADSSWRMSRAQDRVASLMEQHARQADRIAAVERSIAEFNAPKAKEPDEPSSPTPAAARELPPAPPPLSVDEALKAEEEALKALEAAIAPVRRAAALRASAQRSPKSPKSPLRSSALGQSQTTPRSKGTAAQPRTPAAMPVVTNSLVQGTPRDHLHAGHGHGARFSPLALLGTPRAPLPPPSALKSEQRSIFGPPRKTITPARHGLGSSSLLTPLPPAAPGFLAQSVLGPSSSEQATPAPPALSQPTPVKAVAELAREQTPARPESGLIPPTPMPEVAVGGPIKVEGVEIELACVGTAVNKIWETLPDLMEMNSGGEPVPRSADATVKHLFRLSRADPQRPASPSDTTPAVTQEAILLAHTTLLLLRSADSSSGAEPDMVVPIPEVKANLEAVARARGWDGPTDHASRTVFVCVGRKLARLDRRGGGGGRMRFSS